MLDAFSCAGIERFTVAHDRGSSHGLSRIIRMAYWEHPDYVPLLRRAYELWRKLEAETHMVSAMSPTGFQRGPACRPAEKKLADQQKASTLLLH